MKRFTASQYMSRDVRIEIGELREIKKTNGRGVFLVNNFLTFMKLFKLTA